MKKSSLLSLILILFTTVFSIQSAFAVSQFSRKFEVGCSTCHTAFPRLNVFGEQFMRNGYQMPGNMPDIISVTQDGDKKNTAVNNRLNIDDLQNLFGVRINITAVEIKQNSLDIDGSQQTATNFGKTPWLQLITAGSLYKNTSIFIESELNTSNNNINNTWFRIGFHNLFGPQGAANIHVGKISPMEWHAASGRLNMFPQIMMRGTFSTRTSGGVPMLNAAEDQVSMAMPMPGISFYGSRGPVLYSVGITNGANMDDENDHKNGFATLRYDIQSGDYRGSALSIWSMRGTDSANTGSETTPVAQTTNDFTRSSIAANLRRGDLDVIVAYFSGDDDNWSLGMIPDKNEFNGSITQIGYNFTPKIYGVLQYDKVNSDDANDHADMVTLSGWYLPRENMRIGLIGLINCDGEKQNELSMVIRSMF